MDVWTWEQLEKQGVDPNTVCDICPCNQGINRGDAYTQGPCGQKQCWFTLGADDEDDYFGNCPRSTCGRGERQRLGMIMREKV